MVLLALTLAFAGFAGLSLSMDRHHRQVWRRTPARRASVLYRALGIALIGGALGAAAAAWGLSVGIVAWLGLLTVAALAVALLLAFAPRTLPAAGCALPLLGAAAAIAAG